MVNVHILILMVTLYFYMLIMEINQKTEMICFYLKMRLVGLQIILKLIPQFAIGAYGLIFNKRFGLM